MENFDATTILKIERILRDNSKRGIFKTKEILSVIYSKGFFSCFYYDAVDNISTNDYQLFLSSVVGTKKQEIHEGSSVDYRDTSISQAVADKIPVIQVKNDSYQSAPLKAHTDLLDVTDKYRVHVPIYYEDLLIGALSCSWKGESTLSEEQISNFALIGSLISRYWKIANGNLANKILEKLKSNIFNGNGQRKIDVVLDDASKLIREALDVSVVSLFHYNWYSSRLTKIHECRSDLIKGLSIEESYESGKFLTGVAWEQTGYRHIVDFDEFLVKFNQHVCAKSFEYHSNLIGDIKTILYSPFGTKSQYFLRLMNRNDRGDFPFFSSHQIVLEHISNRIGELIDDMVNENRMFSLQQVAKTAISNITSLDKTISKTKAALVNECVDDLGVMAFTQKEVHFTHKYFTNEHFKKAISQYCSWENDNFYHDCINAKSIIALRVKDYEEHTKDNHLARCLYINKVSFVLIVPFGSIGIRGFLIITSPELTKGSVRQVLNRLPKFHMESLTAYAGLIGGCVESADSHLTSENARRLIGQIGHEIQGPVSELGQTAIDTIYESLELIDGIDSLDDSVKSKIKMTLNRNELLAANQMSHIRQLMNIAVDMAQESSGVLQVTFDDFNLYDLLLAASKESKRDEYIDYKSTSHRIQIEFNDACKSMINYVGDKSLIHKVFVNVFRNAIKYSLPRYRGKPITIHVNGIPQSGQFIFEVINWGVPLEDNIVDKIFNAFERGDSHDRLKARRGMGLGLYIARRFLVAHKGVIFCQKSKPTLNDPSRRDIEGWQTTFEIRLPFGLPRGIHDDQA